MMSKKMGGSCEGRSFRKVVVYSEGSLLLGSQISVVCKKVRKF